MNQTNMPPHEQKKILIIGAAGGLAQIVIKKLLRSHPQVKILGIDSRPVNQSIKNLQLQLRTIRYTLGQFESIFRDFRPDTVLHLGRITQAGSQSAKLLQQRLELNVMGTKIVLDLCKRHEVKQVLLLSSFLVYGARNDNPLFLDENAPLRASLDHPDLRDVVEMDQMGSSWMWQHINQVNTIILRPCSIIGPHIMNAVTKLIMSKHPWRPIDYAPMYQFIYQNDMGLAIIKAISDPFPSGIYNVAPSGQISITDALEILHPGKTFPFPVTLLEFVNKGLHYFRAGVPDYLIDYLKFSCLVDTKAFDALVPKNFFRCDSTKALYALKEQLPEL
jgi:UDP-glucose 4-epimerase